MSYIERLDNCQLFREINFMKKMSSEWTFLSNYSHVLVCLAQDPAMRMRDIATRVGITERSVQRIIRELVDADVLEAKHEGRRNHYHVNLTASLRHPLESHRTVGHLLAGVLEEEPQA